MSKLPPGFSPVNTSGIAGTSDAAISGSPLPAGDRAANTSGIAGTSEAAVNGAPAGAEGDHPQNTTAYPGAREWK